MRHASIKPLVRVFTCNRRDYPRLVLLNRQLQIAPSHALAPSALTCRLPSLQDRPGLVVLTIELETALSQMLGSYSPSKMWSPYRAPLARFLCKYTSEVRHGWSVW